MGFVIDPYSPEKFFKNLDIKELKNKMKEYSLNIKKYKIHEKLLWEENEIEFLKQMNKVVKE